MSTENLNAQTKPTCDQKIIGNEFVPVQLSTDEVLITTLCSTKRSVGLSSVSNSLPLTMSSTTHFTSVLSLALNDIKLEELVKSWLQEDCPSMDYASCVVGTQKETAVLLFKSREGVLAGIPFFEATFKALGCTCEWLGGIMDGDDLQQHQRLALVRGRARDILRGERVALNCLSRVSGISTGAHNVVSKVRRAGWKGRVAGTRKTTPGFRLAEKYALMVGGADGHRYDLSSMVMLKDNHIWASGNVKQAVSQCKQLSGFSIKIEVECRSLEEAREAAKASCDVVMLDNFHPKAVNVVAKKLKEEFPDLTIDVSGGIDFNNVTEYIGPDVDVVSMGMLTQQYHTLDFSLKLLKDGHNPENPLVTVESAA